MRNIPQNTGGERIFGSERFLKLTRKPDLPLHTRFEPTVKAPGDVVI